MKKYDFKTRYDIAVIGGGIAGCAAALQSARRGKKTILLEKNVLPGGLATCGLVYIYLPLCDGCGHQVTFGIAEELLKNSLKLGPGEIPPRWRQEIDAPESRRFRCSFSPASFMLSLEKLLQENGVDLWYDTLFCEPVMRQNRLVGLEVRNESGLGLIEISCCVDASGSAVIGRRANLPCLTGTNYLTSWNMEYNAGKNGAFGENLDCHTISLNTFEAESQIRMTPELRHELYPELSEAEVKRRVTFRGISGKLMSTFLAESHRILRMRYENSLRKRSELFPVNLPGMAQFRKLCCIQGRYVLKTGDEKKEFSDSIGLAGDWRRPGPIWEIPYRSLLPAGDVEGMLFAGRCSSAEGDAWEITRVIPVAAMTGQVAGLAAAMAVEQGVPPGSLPPEQIQKELVKMGFVLHRIQILSGSKEDIP